MTDLIIIQTGEKPGSGTKELFEKAEARFVQTTEHPFIKKLGLSGNFTSMDDLYESCEDYDELNRCIAGRLVEAAEFIVKEDSGLTAAPLSRLRLRDGVLVAAILREGRVLTPRGSDRIQKGDSVVIVTDHLGLHDMNDLLQ